jgi:hypothetical protein
MMMSEKDKLVNKRYLKRLIQSLYQEFPDELMEVLQESNRTLSAGNNHPEFHRGDVVEVRNSVDEVWQLDQFTGISVRDKGFPYGTSRGEFKMCRHAKTWVKWEREELPKKGTGYIMCEHESGNYEVWADSMFVDKDTVQRWSRLPIND